MGNTDGLNAERSLIVFTIAQQPVGTGCRATDYFTADRAGAKAHRLGKGIADGVTTAAVTERSALPWANRAD